MKKTLITLITFLPFFIASSINALTLNLKNVKLTTLINTVSEVTGKNFIVDPRVKGKINVVSTQEIDDDEFYHLFLSILQVHGYIVIEGDGFSKILPQSNTKNNSAQLSSLANDSIVTTVIPIKNVAASQMIAILRPIISRYGHLAAYTPSNTIIVIDTRANLVRLRKIINQLDTEIDDDYELMPLINASADEVAKIIKSLLPRDAKQTANPLTIAIDKNNNQLIVGGAPAKRLKVRFLVKELDKDAGKGGDTIVIYLKYAKAKDILPVLQSIGKQLVEEGKKSIKQTVNIHADEATNAIIITAPSIVASNIKNVIAKLDIRRAQVLIEAIIAEVSIDNTESLGIQWAVKNGNGIGLIDFTGSLAAAVSGKSTFGKGANVAIGKYNSATESGFGAILTALSQQGDVNILSTPSIVTIDNEEATILVGEEVPFITNKQIVSGNSNPFQNFERKDIGIKLKVKPQINNGDTIRLDIEQEISKVTNQGSASDLITSKRTINTSVMVADNKILVLGGLIDETVDITNSSIPLLSSIPILGELFKYSSEKKVKKNLLIFIHPTILTDQLVADKVSMEKYNYIYQQQVINGGARLPERPLDIPPVTTSPATLPTPKKNTVKSATPIDRDDEVRSIEEFYPEGEYD
ncbi:General secretion pathway protein D [hydrothermal vent metagenome]|uniref:General secretion pathway protein D n=1 Tax=hydrothermal vent metagenome TaxID=652676 RepID=A0A1W1DZX8_9ZZZZ